MQSGPAYFFEQYSRMSDEELAYLLLTRGDALSEEARHALQVVMAQRDPAKFERELQATREDVVQQVEELRAQMADRQMGQARTRTIMRSVCLLMIVGGLPAALIPGNADGGLLTSASGVALLCLLELNWRFWGFVSRLFGTARD